MHHEVNLIQHIRTLQEDRYQLHYYKHLVGHFGVTSKKWEIQI